MRYDDSRGVISVGDRPLDSFVVCLEVYFFPFIDVTIQEWCLNKISVILLSKAAAL